MASDGGTERPEEYLIGLTGEEWGGVVTGFSVGAALLWSTADFPLYVQGPAVLLGLIIGLAVGVSVTRSVLGR